MAKLYRKKLLLAKTETTYGTDPTPTGAANAILTRDLSISLMQGNTADRSIDRNTLGNDAAIHIAPYTQVSFSVEVAGAGAAGTAPSYGPLLKACGFSETVTTSTSVSYAPVSSAFSSVTLYYNTDGILHILTGARGTVSFAMDPGGLPLMNFTFTGIRTAPTDTAMVSPTLTGFKTPIPVNNANTPTFTLHSYEATMERFSLDVANEVVYRNVVNEESVQIVDRAPTGSVSIEEVALATKNFHSIIIANTEGALQMVHGTAAGYIVQLDAPKVQLLQPSYTESNGVLLLEMQMRVNPNAGDDELVITVK